MRATGLRCAQHHAAQFPAPMWRVALRSRVGLDAGFLRVLGVSLASHPSSEAGAVAQTVTDVPSGLSLYVRCKASWNEPVLREDAATASHWALCASENSGRPA
jgi:hypothetical protein